MKKAVEAQGMVLLAFILIGLLALTVAFKGLDISKGLVDKILNFLRVPESGQQQYLPEALNSVSGG